ncbi:hypothetical protein M0811_14553 [Anaeramoeba ignava]|uniref:Uncharacterized protein n=1 Tax=Anaeramoeba ignava TaxID=1746090 RepID=A0A9Q0RHW1_ANAIG|nr:hypothetical protein M0811_14553 [Anaeramoeba ignava]
MAKKLSAFVYFKLLKNNQEIFNEIRNDSIIVFFDGRFDSSRDAQFCTIIFMESGLFPIIWVGNTNLNRANQLFIDGTFKISPKKFTQDLEGKFQIEKQLHQDLKFSMQEGSDLEFGSTFIFLLLQFLPYLKVDRNIIINLDDLSNVKIKNTILNRLKELANNPEKFVQHYEYLTKEEE